MHVLLSLGKFGLLMAPQFQDHQFMNHFPFCSMRRTQGSDTTHAFLVAHNVVLPPFLSILVCDNRILAVWYCQRDTSHILDERDQAILHMAFNARPQQVTH